jgi:hypothetical protein
VTERRQGRREGEKSHFHFFAQKMRRLFLAVWRKKIDEQQHNVLPDILNSRYSRRESIL